jgi:phage terminase small subunit
LKRLEKRSVFVREYLVDRNGTRAAIAAGYAPRSASVTSCRLLRNAKVCAEVAELTEERLERLEVTADTVLQELAKIAFTNMKDYLSVREDGSVYVDISKITPVQAAGLADLRIDEYISERGTIKRTRLKLGAKTRALELLGKHLKLWSDRVEAAHDSTLRERLERARQRVLQGMSDEELNAKIKELQTQLESRHPKFNIEFKSPDNGHEHRCAVG